jgi:hypothetical protein
VKDPIPIDFLDKIPDKERDLKSVSESVADDFLRNLEISQGGVLNADRELPEKFLISSMPYERKSNLVADKAMVNCWETQLRFNEFDLYVSIIRRRFIPPVMDTFQDIVVCSKFTFNLEKDERQGKEN